MKEILYSVLTYKPSLVASDTMTVGILFYIPENEYREFISIKKPARLKSINSKISIDDINAFLGSISDEIRPSLYSDFDIEKYIYYYTNEFQFSSVTNVVLDERESYESFIDKTHRMYLSQDFSVKDRPSTEDQLKYLKQIGKLNKYYSSKSIIGKFNDNLNVDFTVGNLAVKFFDFNNKKSEYQFNIVKAWVFNAIHSVSNVKLVFIYSYTDNNGDKDIKNVIDILKTYDHSYDLLDGIEYIKKNA
ncbi:hypothetical protein [Proteiniclasticum ruminis]|uniref:hypothetical protein n=1 Tax=Proteiniclasticum ruminis TaxID=398199 RepID=UPI0028ACED51|nr:hypothetical protein [Proteiniclasticum ruminis]